MRELPHTRSCFVCGESNPSGLALRFHTDGRVVSTRFRPGTGHIGFQDTVHGGIISTVLDEIMVWACAVHTRRFAYCAELKVRFTAPARPGRELVATAELVLDRRGKIFEARAELRTAENELLASATGKYLPVPTVDLAPMVADFVGDLKNLFPSP